MRRPFLPFIMLLGALLAGPALGTVHLMVIEEVFIGPPSDAFGSLTPDQRAQYVVLRMTAAGQTQTFTNATFVRVEDANGNVLGRFGTFTSDQGNGGGLPCLGSGYPVCPAIVIGTQAAESLFTFSLDEIVDGQARVALPPGGGRVCFMSAGLVYDCVAWGNFSCPAAACPGGPNTLRAGELEGSGCDGNYGVPAAAGGLVFGRTLDRGGFSCAAKDNAADYALVFPRPANNAGANDNVDADVDGLIDVLDCNDASGAELWQATRVANLQVTHPPGSTGADLSWNALDPAIHGAGVTYDVPRGDLSDLPGFALAGCLDPDTPVTTSADGAVPATGDGFYYDVRGGDAAACAGPYGPGRAGLGGACP